MTPRRFPPGFLWGTATAAHQVEGQNTNNQWWEWEQKPGTIWRGDRSGDACGWWRDPAPDLDRAAALSHNALRLSVEWSRIEPREGQLDIGALARYRDLLLALRERGIEPMVTLHHFTEPRWLAAEGGWLSPRTPERFGRFAARVLAELGDLCTLWCTINEPVIYAVNGYTFGVWPPGERSFDHTLQVLPAMLRGHAAAAEAVRRAGPQHRVGIVHNLRLFDPLTADPRDVVVASLYDFLFNESLLVALRTGRLPPPFTTGLREVAGLRHSIDFFGLNYYTRERVQFDPARPARLYSRYVIPPGVPHSDLGMAGETYGEIYPHGMYRALKRAWGLGVPIYITETGLPDADDDQRPDFLLSHLGAVHRAIREGVDVRGVFVWTLVDNFEWAEGWGLRFGLYALDERTGERRLRPSGALYAIIARANALPG